jgi:hypothetical protein
MLIIKPYGRSHTSDTDGTRHRTLRLTAAQHVDVGIENFASQHPQLLLAQWISVIDKIACKPGQDKETRRSKLPTKTQRQLRGILGVAAWALLAQRLGSDATGLHELWLAKIHPYGDGDDRPKFEPKAEGRWYGRFVDSIPPARVTAEIASGVAQKIDDHLHKGAFFRNTATHTHPDGVIAARAKSIAQNVHKKPSDKLLEGAAWTPEDEDRYFATDIAADIHALAKQEDTKTKGKKPLHGCRGPVGYLFYKHYARVFAVDGAVLKREEAGKSQPGLLKLHDAAKSAYKNIFERQKLALKHFPQKRHMLLSLIGQKRGNRQLAALVRLGKVIHYEAASAGTLDSPSNVTSSWPGDVADSRYWTSDGQTDIKRNEALVRVWRSVIALAARTLKDWVDPDGMSDTDIFLKAGKDAADQNFTSDQFSRKVELLFGDRRSLFLSLSEADKKAVVMLAIEGWAQLRHNSFHFQGRAGFVAALARSTKKLSATVPAHIVNLWHTDSAARVQRLKNTLRGVFADTYLDQPKLDQVFTTVETHNAGHSPMPRFRRMLKRAEDGWKGKDRLGLPAVPNRTELEAAHARLCQYTLLKLIYERAFPEWLDKATTDQLNGWIDRANAHRTAAAIRMNEKNQKTKPVARTIQFGRLEVGEKFGDFVSRMTAATATEFRVQRGYNSDAEKAQEQAVYLDELRCDVTAQGFAFYLQSMNFEWLLKMRHDAAPAHTRADIDRLASTVTPVAATDWQQMLYFLIHLVPVEEISKLLHQLRKWQILETKGAAEATPVQDRMGDVSAVLGLYLDMHDAKADGGKKIAVPDAFKALFENEQDFKKLFENPDDISAHAYVPVRGLREMLRFGNLVPLKPVFDKYKITSANVAALLEADKTIAGSQAEREKLHEAWVKEKPSFSSQQKDEYKTALAAVVHHRQLASQARLTNHVRLHRLLVQVLGRLVDYSGLWERDVYFVTLALIQLAGKNPSDVFDNQGLLKLGEGQIVAAVRGLTDANVKDQLKQYFGSIFDGDDIKIDIRNNLAHLNMLKTEQLPVNLTAQVNATRCLMGYDRKLKNAVSVSVMELLAREGVKLAWDPKNHDMTAARLVTGQADHLGGKDIQEPLHAMDYIGMVAQLFEGTANEPAPWVPAKKDRFHDKKQGRYAQKGHVSSKFSSGKR